MVGVVITIIKFVNGANKFLPRLLELYIAY
jgi:hypothetical protein